MEVQLAIFIGVITFSVRGYLVSSLNKIVKATKIYIKNNEKN